MSYQFKSSWLISSFFFVLILGFLSSGISQLNRANNKLALQHMIDQRSSLGSLSLNMPLQEFSPYQTVQATGKYRTKDSILLDNIDHQGQDGYYLITPFEIMASHSIILVNRGWLPQNINSENLPTFKTPKGIITLEGHLSYPRSQTSSTSNSSKPLSTTPPLWDYLDIELFSQINGYSTLPLILKLNADGQTNTLASTPVPNDEVEPNLIKDWSKYNSNSDEHFNYAILLFSFALFGLLLYIGISFKKQKRLSP